MIDTLTTRLLALEARVAELEKKFAPKPVERFEAAFAAVGPNLFRIAVSRRRVLNILCEAAPNPVLIPEISAKLIALGVSGATQLIRVHVNGLRNDLLGTKYRIQRVAGGYRFYEV